ncbi:hypothetical protein Ga0074812_10693 [Parafrankia irregularis]|uniref:Uncharacterized protein n=1 Tax=Parafrankia irregularis TaxID=795642 RepID=A0A0S4QL70_9ACTN|nr:hypothetical protein Ga0074812_10693 [Parafrankia irregularis]
MLKELQVLKELKVLRELQMLAEPRCRVVGCMRDGSPAPQ